MLSRLPLLVLKMELESNKIAEKFEIKLQQNWLIAYLMLTLTMKRFNILSDIIPKLD